MQLKLVAPKEKTPIGLQQLYKVAWILFALQFLLIGGWKTLMYERFAGTMDEALYQQGDYLISRGHLNPYATEWSRYVIQDHGAIIWWFLAPLDWVPPLGLWLQWVAVGTTVSAEVVAFHWICRTLNSTNENHNARWRPILLASSGLFILLFNPWTALAVSFDIHAESFASLFIILAAYDFSSQKFKRGWIWVIFTLFCGDVTGTWIVGLGLSAMVAGFLDARTRRIFWTQAVFLAMAGIGWTTGLSSLGLAKGSSLVHHYSGLVNSDGGPLPPNFGTFSLVKFLVTHPIHIVAKLHRQLKNIYANLAPMGLIGSLTTWTFGVPLVVLLANNLSSGNLFSEPLFQSLPVYTFGTVGIVVILDYVTLRWQSRTLMIALVSIIVVNCSVWSFIFTPHLKSSWILTNENQAANLASIDKKIPESAEVIASQGIIARFSFRKYVYGWSGQNKIYPVHSRNVWFVITPSAGIETASVIESFSLIDSLADHFHAQLVEDSHGVYVFHLSAMKDERFIRTDLHTRVISAWATTGPEGKPITSGTTRNWHASSRGGAGYIVSGDYWNAKVGEYEATVTIKNPSPVNVEVWNATSNTLLARSDLEANYTVTKVNLPFDVPIIIPQHGIYSGTGFFSYNPPTAPYGFDHVEIRIYEEKGGHASVYQLSIRKM